MKAENGKGKIMKNILYSLFIILGLTACHKPVQVVSFTTEAIPVDASTDGIQDESYVAHLAPIKAQLEEQMNVQLGYAPEALWVGSPECPMLNWASDALLNAARRTYTEEVHFAVVNIGGMRCSWPAGPITRGTVFELMPFDNRLVLLTLKGQDVLDLCQAFADYGGQGVAGLRMTAVDGKLADVTIGGKAVDPQALYHVATSDYLSGGADHMEALARYSECKKSDLIIRDLYIEEVARQDTIRAAVDGRMNLL